MNKYILLFCFSIVLFGCKEPEYKYYHSRLYPIKYLGNDTWEKTAHFINIPISLCLESRLYEEEYPTTLDGLFEPFIMDAAGLFFDKDIVFLKDTIQLGTNLLETQYVKIETTKFIRNGKYYDSYYVLWINKENISNFFTSKGYYTVYFKAITKNNYHINDSTVICIE